MKRQKANPERNEVLPVRRPIAGLIAFVFVFNILLSFATVVAGPALGGPAVGSPSIDVQICSPKEDRAHPNPDDHRSHGPNCPLCLLLGGQALAVNSGETASIPYLSAVAHVLRPSSGASLAILAAARPQAARAPPILI